MRIIHEDNHCLVVFKPPNILSQKSKKNDISLLELVKLWLKNKYHKKGNVFLGVIHRIDKPACGLVLLAKTSKGAARLSENLRNGLINKTYLAIVENSPPKNKDTITNYLSQNGSTKIDISLTPKSSYKKASLHYNLLKKGTKTSLIEIKLLTGRKHQIRAQMSFIGCPIIGDKKYGAKMNYQDKAIGLIAKSLEFKHPTTKDTIYVELTKKDVNIEKWII